VPSATEVRTTCPRDCYDACGIVVTQLAGERPRIRGDRDHPVSRGQLCQKCALAYNGIFLDPAARLTSPLRRIGEKGTGRFEPVTWDDALAEIAARLRPIIDDGDAGAILNTHYTGTFAMIGYHFPLRFFHRLGATEVDPDTICNKAGHAALEYLYGTSLEGFDPRSAASAASILIWGANPSASAPHQHEHWMTEAPCPKIVVDPLRTPSAAQADLHLQPRPGTDAALAFGLLHVLWRDHLLDRSFLDRCTVGWAEIEPLVAQCPPVWAQEVTGVPAARIEQAAHWFGAGPSLLWIGQGLQRQPSGGNIVRAVSLLPAVTGAIGRPGGGFLYLNGIETRGLDGDYLIGRHLAASEPASISHMDLATVLEEPEKSRALFCWNINIAASNPQQRRLRRALTRDDLFTVVVDLFATDTADLADIVLPAASFLEHDDLVVSYFHHSLSAQVKAAEPPGDALPNAEIFRRLAAAMGFDEAALYESDASILTCLLAQSGTGLSFEALSAVGTVWPDQIRMQFASLRFATPSGRIELASTAAEADGLPRIPTPSVDSPPAHGRLRLLSPSSEWMLNTAYSNDPRVQRRAGGLTVSINPAEAVALGLTDGQMAEVGNDTGRLELAVTITDDVPSGVALIPKGRWPKQEAGMANVNALNPGERSDMGSSSAVHGTEVFVRPSGYRISPAPA
jgi:anaerobic selenocysteine-containing dehydrogenase